MIAGLLGKEVFLLKKRGLVKSCCLELLLENFVLLLELMKALTWLLRLLGILARLNSHNLCLLMFVGFFFDYVLTLRR